jgi:hypothetical protein
MNLVPGSSVVTDDVRYLAVVEVPQRARELAEWYPMAIPVITSIADALIRGIHVNYVFRRGFSEHRSVISAGNTRPVPQ